MADSSFEAIALCWRAAGRVGIALLRRPENAVGPAIQIGQLHRNMVPVFQRVKGILYGRPINEKLAKINYDQADVHSYADGDQRRR